jgi:serine/threonine-protein kinase
MDKLPAKIGRFLVRREVGRGAMGVVLEVEDPDLRRRLALKVVRSETPALARLEREALIAARLDHPNIVRVYETGAEGEFHYIAMEFIDGRPFEDLVEGTPLEERLRILEDVARALDYAHRQGVVHRDVKPANVLVDAKGHAWLTDFGLARGDALRTQLTRTGAVMGTPMYMAPEQVRGESHTAGPAADIYSLGVMLYRCLSGRAPFDAVSATELYQQILIADPAPLNRHDGFERVCFQAMEKEGGRRYATSSRARSACAGRFSGWRT